MSLFLDFPCSLVGEAKVTALAWCQVEPICQPDDEARRLWRRRRFDRDTAPARVFPGGLERRGGSSRVPAGRAAPWPVPAPLLLGERLTALR
jgi:hypothetical protein